MVNSVGLVVGLRKAILCRRVARGAGRGAEVAHHRGMRPTAITCARSTATRDTSEDLHLVMQVLDAGEDDERWREGERDAFESMAHALRRGGKGAVLSSKQRVWLDDVAKRLDLAAACENAFSSGKVRAGKPVETIPCLRRENLPMKPPGRGAGGVR